MDLIAQNQPDGTIEATAVVSNAGLLDFSGTLELSLPFWPDQQTVTVAVGELQTLVFSIRTVAAEPGDYTIQARVLDNELNSVAEASAEITVSPASIVLTSVPEGAEFDAGTIATMEFGVENQGGQAGRADLRFLFETIDQPESLWLQPGEGLTVLFNFFLPEDLEDNEYTARLTLNDAVVDVPFRVNGVKLQVAAALDQNAYVPGDTAHLTLTVTNVGAAGDVDLFARLTYGDFTATEQFVLVDQIQLDFDIPLTEILSQKLFYGIYFDSGRSLWLDALYLRAAAGGPGDISLLTDRPIYHPGEAVIVTVLTDQTGDLTATAPGLSDTITVAGETQFSFVLPGAMTQRTYFINWSFGEQHGALPFDVLGMFVRVLECRLDKPRYYPGQELITTLLLDFGQETNAQITGEIYGPDGSRNDAFTVTGSYATGQVEVSGTGTVASSVSGIHRLNYRIVDSASGMILAAGREAFDVGDGTMISLGTERAEYEEDEPIVAVVGLVGHNGDGVLTLYLDDLEVWQQPVQFDGYESVMATIGTAALGPHALRAVLTVGELTSERNATFVVILRNAPPVCDIGGPYVEECQGTTTSIALDGSASTDPDLDDTLTFTWTSIDCPGASFDDAGSPTPLMTLTTDPGCSVDCTATLTVTDEAGEFDTCVADVSVGDSAPPSITCPVNVTLECPADTSVEVNGMATGDDDCGVLTMAWVDSSVPGPGATETITRTWTATDECGHSAACEQSVDVVDTTSPVVTCSTTTEGLWSPDHKLVGVGLVTSVTDEGDPAGAAESLRVEVWSDETETPDTGDGTGKHAPDAKDIYTGLRLRNERRATEDGRVYLVIARAEDASGNVGFGYCAVVVPHDQSQEGLEEVAVQADAALAAVANAPGTTIAEKVGPLNYYRHGVSEELGPHQ